MAKRKAQYRPSFTSIDLIMEEKRISESEIVAFSDIDYPLFSFKWLQDYSIDKCKDPKFFHDYLMRLQKLSILGWQEIRKSSRHNFGMEKIPVSQIKPELPKDFTRDVEELDVFRAVGDNRPMLGFQEGRIFHVIFIEAKFGDVYNH